MQEQSTEARLIRLFYHETRDALMRGAHWNFTRTVGYLSILKAAPGTPQNQSNGGPWTPDSPPPPWQYSYAYPSDCLLMRYISPLNIASGLDVSTQQIWGVPSLAAMPSHIALRPQPFLVGIDKDKSGNRVRCVLANQDRAIGIYSQRVTEPDLWDPAFMAAFEAGLASRLCIPLSGDKSLKKQLNDDAMQALQAARLSDGNESLETENWIPDWIRARGYAGDFMFPGNSFVGSFTTPGFLSI